jgi:hypothetical protein
VSWAANLLYLLGLLAVAFLVVGLIFSEPDLAAEEGGWPEWLSNSLLLGPFAVVPSLLGIFVARDLGRHASSPGFTRASSPYAAALHRRC